MAVHRPVISYQNISFYQDSKFRARFLAIIKLPISTGKFLFSSAGSVLEDLFLQPQPVYEMNRDEGGHLSTAAALATSSNQNFANPSNSFKKMTETQI